MTDDDLTEILKKHAPFAVIHPIGRRCFETIEQLVAEVRRLNGMTPAPKPPQCQHVLTELEPDTDSEDYIRCLGCGKTGTVVPCWICNCRFCECCQRGLR